MHCRLWSYFLHSSGDWTSEPRALSVLCKFSELYPLAFGGFEAESHYIAQAGLGLAFLLLQPGSLGMYHYASLSSPEFCILMRKEHCL